MFEYKENDYIEYYKAFEEGRRLKDYQIPNKVKISFDNGGTKIVLVHELKFPILGVKR